MTDKELQQKWPYAQFEKWQREGIFSRTLTYEKYLAFRRAQQLETAQQLRALSDQYGELPGEQSPVLSAQDEEDLRAAWEETAEGRARNKLTDQPERLAA